MKIAISGSYSTGKSTMALALAYLTGLPHTQARTMRQILPQTFPGKKLEECTTNELVELGIRRFTERCIAESVLSQGFVSDGSSLQEWTYGSGRVRAGLTPTDKLWKSQVLKMIHAIKIGVFGDTMKSLEQVVKNYAMDKYDVIIHLPVEFPFVADGHRPVSERFRYECDVVLRRTYKELDLKIIEVSGKLEDRLATVCKMLNLEMKISVEEAIQLAAVRMRQYNLMLDSKS